MNVLGCFFLDPLWWTFGTSKQDVPPFNYLLHLLLFALNLPPASFTWCSLVLILENKANSSPLVFCTHDCVFSLVWPFSVGYHFSSLRTPCHSNPWITLILRLLHIFSYICCSSLDICHFCYTWARATRGRHAAALPIISVELCPGMSQQLCDSFWASNRSFHRVIKTIRSYFWVGTSWLEISCFQSLYCSLITAGIVTSSTLVGVSNTILMLLFP